MDEIWKKIKNFNGEYEVSNYGNVRSIRRKNHRGYWINGRVLKPYIDRYGYLIFTLTKDGKRHYCLAHRLVGIEFLSSAGDQINHINGNKTDNRLSNLEWCNSSQNQKHAYKNGLKCASPNTRPGRHHSKFKGLVVAKNISTGNELILEGRSDMVSKGFLQSCVSRCLLGKQKTHKGHAFQYLERIK